MGDAVQGRLRRAPRGRPGRKSVEPILEDVEVGSAQIHHAESVQAMPGAMKGVAVVSGAAVLHHFTHLRQHPAVQFFHLLALDRIGARIEVRQIAQTETKRVAHLSVAFHRLRQQARPDAHVGVIVHRRRHQTQNLRPVLLADLPRGDNIPQRLRHRAALSVQHPAVRHHCAVRRPFLHRQCHQQRAVEPTPVLVAALQVHVRRPAVLRPAPEHRQVAGAGIKPHVQNVSLLAEAGLAAVGAARSLRQQVFGGVAIPGVGALALEPLHRLAQHGDVGEFLSAALAVENRNGNAPHPLAGDAPVGPGLDHSVDAILAPRRHPLHLFDFFQCPLPQPVVLQVDEPLLGRAEDERVMAAPTMRIGVLDFLRAHQMAALAQQSNNVGVGLEDLLAAISLQPLGQAALCVHRAVNLQPILLAGLKVLGAVAGGGVDDAGTLLQGDVVS